MIYEYYIAYGSNLNLEQMAARCPTASAVGAGLLQGYQLLFNGVATLIPKKNSSVPVAIWKIDEACEKALDIYEGYPRLYRKEYIPIVLDGETQTAMVYIMNDYRPAYPPRSYLSIIEQGYKDFGLNHSYLQKALLYTNRLIKR